MQHAYVSLQKQLTVGPRFISILAVATAAADLPLNPEGAPWEQHSELCSVMSTSAREIALLCA